MDKSQTTQTPLSGLRTLRWLYPIHGCWYKLSRAQRWAPSVGVRPWWVHTFQVWWVWIRNVRQRKTKTKRELQKKRHRHRRIEWGGQPPCIFAIDIISPIQRGRGRPKTSLPKCKKQTNWPSFILSNTQSIKWPRPRSKHPVSSYTLGQTSCP